MREITLTGADQQIVTTTTAVPFATYRGVTIRETTGVSTALVRIWDGTSATGRVLDEISLLPNESAREDYGDPAPTARTGVFVQVVSGTIVGSVRVD
jgi:hypothetical protein